MKYSGGARELGIEGLDEFREIKHVHWEAQAFHFAVKFAARLARHLPRDAWTWTRNIFWIYRMLLFRRW